MTKCETQQSTSEHKILRFYFIILISLFEHVISLFLQDILDWKQLGAIACLCNLSDTKKKRKGTFVKNLNATLEVLVGVLESYNLVQRERLRK